MLVLFIDMLPNAFNLQQEDNYGWWQSCKLSLELNRKKNQVASQLSHFMEAKSETWSKDPSQLHR